ncbi:MAG: hypothetical protein AEth_01026 [Candidatus Argoarchaeum ethanivorans]|uniref:Uncharacterized protein n=1 Tax=Candidatus Argoarchaeum ethanivorans TaxID=2608793 RepID=A0A8B3S210_9EURY|nr:MAG: hypothetical protein AEth_01026 [Candidatus Argoarchaeum ethanivorans]
MDKNGPAAIRTQDLTVISRALHLAKLQARCREMKQAVLYLSFPFGRGCKLIGCWHCFGLVVYSDVTPPSFTNKQAL